MYGSIDGVKDNLPRLAPSIKADELATDKTDIKESTVTRYLTEYTAQVDAALAGRYELPLSGELSQALASKIVNDLAAYKMARRFWINIDSNQNHEIQAMRKDAKEILDGLASGSYSLPDQEPIFSDGDMESLLAEAQTEEVIFDMEDPASWQDKLN
jgi:phage gp36-like protein